MSNILLIVDLQKEYKDNKGRYNKCIDYINKYKDQYDKVVATLFVNDKAENSSFIKKLKYKECQNIDYSSLEFNLDDVQIVYKYGYSLPMGFFNKKDNIYIIGCETDACILANCFTLWDDNINFNILTDYIYTTNTNYNKKVIEQLYIRNFGKRVFINNFFIPMNKNKNKNRGIV